jgi:hypothetical protein
MKHPDVTAVALSMINAKLPSTLVREWFSQDDLYELADEEGEIEF